MANYDSAAIIRAYADTVKIIDGDRGVFDKSGNEIILDQSKVDAARAEIDAENTSTLYKTQRTGEAGTTENIYLPLDQQLDMQYWDLVNGTTTWKDHVTSVKAAHPKPG